LDGLKEAARIAARQPGEQAGDKAINLCRRQSSFELPIMFEAGDGGRRQQGGGGGEANRAARGADPKVRQVTVSYRDISQKVIIANSLGDWVEDERIRTNLSVNVIAMEDDQDPNWL
jgi:TldD protein